MLINCTNHPYETWREPLRQAAANYGEVVDVPFPQIMPQQTSVQLRQLVEELSAKIEAMEPEAVIAAGEFTFLFMLVDKLLADGVKVMCTCSKRTTTETLLPDGTNEKKSLFVFECFREYEYFQKR